MTDCWPGDDDTLGYCGCPMDNPIAVFLLHVTLIWFLLPGHVQAQFAGDPCWAADTDWDDDEVGWEYADE